MAKAKGYSYIALTDHSHVLGVARGLSIERLMDHRRELAALNSRMKGFTILCGTEMDIRSDGTLDYPDEVLRELDVVIASIHSGFRQPKAQITARIVAAMRNPYVSLIAHPTGRLIGERDPYEVDMDEVFRVAGETGTALEINSYPLRLDLSDGHARRAKEMGIPLVIDSDVHALSQFDNIHYGVSIARRGWLEKRNVLNTLELPQLRKQLGSKRRKAR
jgi:DNA polymerase (family 10)